MSNSKLLEPMYNVGGQHRFPQIPAQFALDEK